MASHYWNYLSQLHEDVKESGGKKLLYASQLMLLLQSADAVYYVTKLVSPLLINSE